MSKLVLPLICLLSLLAPAGEREKEHRKIHVVIGHGGLVLLAGTQEGFVLAADGSSFNADGTVSLADKLLAVGKRGALLLGGTVAIQDPVGRPVRQEVNVSRLAAAWLQSHPDIEIDAASRDLNTLITDTLARFYATRDPGADADKYKFEVILAGFVGGQPSITRTRYFIPQAKGGKVRTENVATAVKPGELLAFGPVRVKDELLRGKSGALKTFKAEAPVRKFRASAPGTLSPQDYIDLFDVILRAAESAEGKKLETTGAVVAPTNAFATVTAAEGFAWKKP
ncbi:MAG: hypothetical protein LAP21_01295 [Acidobacteriia bacterium]|nr:hypothetical protein [Terriglobia bacterium]